jgi:integrase
MRTHLTELSVRRQRPVEGKRTELFDDIARGLVLRVEPSGLKTWLWIRSRDGARYKIKIGTFPEKTLAEARDEAAALVVKMAAGTLGRKRKAKVAAVQTVEDLKKAFIEDYKLAHKSWRNVEQDLDNHVIPLIGKRRPDKIRRNDIGDVLLELEEMPRVHNKVKSHLSGMFKWAARASRGIVSANPVVGFENMPTESRDNVVRDDDLKAIWAACLKIGYPAGPYCRLLMLLGQRRTETAAMERALVGHGLWEIPPDRTKNRLVHLVPLPPLAVEVIATLPIQIGPDGNPSRFLFPAPTKLSNHITTFSDMKEAIDGAAGVTGWWLHDMRRTVATNMAGLSIPTINIEAVLNHISGEQSDVAGIYNRHKYFAEKKAALEAWANRLAEIVR